MDGSDKDKGKLKRYRRARAGRVLPRSGGGPHKPSKRRLIEEAIKEDIEESLELLEEEEYDYDEDEDDNEDDDELEQILEQELEFGNGNTY